MSEDVCPQCKNPYRFHVEYAYNSPERYDGISESVCVPCDLRIGRWSGKILKEREIETRFGERDPYIPVKCPSCQSLRNPIYPTCFDCHLAQESKKRDE